MLAPGPLTKDAEGRACAIDLQVVLLDGVSRDRCPYVGDQAVSGMTLLISTPSAAPVLRNMILWYATHQHPDGAIPSSPERNGTVVLVDYNAYWVEDVYDYVLYTGDLQLARKVWPELVRLMDDWYLPQIGPSGLFVNSAANADYANIPRTGPVVAYYNAGYVRALGFASQLAGWLGESDREAAWKARIAPVSAAFGPAFWDPAAGAFRDATTGPVVHPQDGNVFAILAGLATAAQSRLALGYLRAHEWQPYGAAIADNDVWDSSAWGTDADRRVYPFISYYELLARYERGLDDSAITLIRREWGYMLANGPRSTMWETIGPYGSAPVNSKPSYDHGWSSGAAPALTSYELGVMPGSPGFGSFLAEPHPADLRWARGTVPTPHGPIAFRWAYVRGAITATVVSPVPGEITLPADGAATLDGKSIPAQWGVTSVKVGRGVHTLVVRIG